MGNIVDSLGRFTVPVKYRKLMNIHPGDELMVSYENGTLLVKKENQMCVFCNSTEELIPFEQRMICKKCLGKLKEGTGETEKRSSKVSVRRRIKTR